MEMKVGRRASTSPKIYGVVIEPIIIWNEKVGIAYHLQFGHAYVCLEVENDK